MENLLVNPPADPFGLFRLWYEAACQTEINDPNAMVLATMGADGFPAARVVLMKDYDPAGFTFYTNYTSNKGQQLTAHPKAALNFHWKSQQQQVRVQGAVTRVSEQVSDAYFATRPRESQLGAWASQQSDILSSREALEQSYKNFENQFRDQTVPRPPHWGGFRLEALTMEFWQAHPFRLHDRFIYKKDAKSGAWSHQRLYP